MNNLAVMVACAAHRNQKEFASDLRADLCVASFQRSSKEHSQYNVREQVERFREFFEFEVMHMANEKSSILECLHEVCASAG